ncbi:MAG: hypothetical protein RBU21_05765 [FCB group bacterium]|nr:hypothetical protein [FCB group bacterium]
MSFCRVFIAAIVFAGLASSGVAADYEDDAYSRPVEDRLSCFDSTWGMMLSGNTVQRSAQFHWNELAPVGQATEWRFKRKGGSGGGTHILLTETLRRAPERISFHVRNNSPKPLSFVVCVYEMDWDKSREKQYSACAMPYLPAIAPGAEADVFVTLADAPIQQSEDTKMRYPARMSINLNEVEDETEYDIFLSDLTVHYPGASDVTVAAVTAPEQMTAGERIEFAVTASGLNPERAADIELRDEPRVLWRIRLTPEEKDALAKAGATSVAREVPWYLPPRELTAGLVVDGYRAAGEAARVRVANKEAPALSTVERRDYNGRPTFFVNDKPLTWSGYASYDYQPGNVNEFGASGADMFVVATNAGQHIHQIAAPTWKGGDVYDFGELDERIAMGLQANPEAFITLRVSLALPTPWVRQHDDSRVRVRSDAGDLPWEETGCPAVSLASEKWRIQQAECLRRLLQHCKQQPYAKRVIAVILGGEVTEEWFAWASNDGQYGDYSATNTEAFAAWCKNKGLPFTAVPLPADRNRAGYDTYPADEAGKSSAAYAQFCSDMSQETIAYFAKVVKDETDRQCLVGVFYGYVVQLAGEPRQHLSGHYALRALLDDENIDHVLGIPLHNFRRLNDGYDLYTSATESIFAHGKSYVNENDLFSWLHNSIWYTEYDPADPRKGAIRMHQRVAANDMVHGVSRQWFSLLASWHHDAGLQEEFAREIALNRSVSEYDRTSMDEVAFVIDDATFASMPPASPLPRATNADLLYALGRTGAPVGVWLLSDLDRLPERIRVVVVASATAARTEDIAKLREVIKRGGKTVVVIGPAGLVDPATMEWNFDATRELTGLPVTIEDAAAPGAATLVADGKEVSSIAALRPRAYSDESGWLQYRDGKAAGGERALDNGGRLIWSGVPPLDSALLRMWLEAAGVHCYAPVGFTVHASAELIAVTAPVAGEAVLHWPGALPVTDLFDGWAGSGKRMTCPFEAGQTRLFAIAGLAG